MAIQRKAGSAHRSSFGWTVGEPILADEAGHYSPYMELPGGCDQYRFSRARGSFLGMAVAVIAAPPVALVGLAVVDQVIGGDAAGVDLAGLVTWTSILAVLSAAIGGLIVAPIVKGGRGHGTWEIFLMALVTYLSAILLTPVVISISALPRVIDGGDVPCNGLSHYQFQCPTGLHGSAALGALIGGAVEIYALALVALLLFLPLLALLLIPAAVWDGFVRREIRRRLQQRSV